MKHILHTLLILCITAPTFAATPTQRRGTATTVANTSGSANTSVAARAARTTPTTTKTTAARAAVPRATRVGGGVVRQPAAQQKNVAARAASTQKVMSTGTSIATAGENTVIDQNCQQKFNGCMDTFCINENGTGGRCMCSNRNKDLVAELAEIEKMDAQSYKLATVGIDAIESNVDVNLLTDTAITPTKKRDLSLWTTTLSDEPEIDMSQIQNQTGNALRASATKLCMDQIPECSAQASILNTMYGTKIKSDCAALENAIKQQKDASQKKLHAAEQELRTAAYEQLQSANKYDLGGCVIEFRKCMATTGGCNDDFSGCVGIAAAENAKTGAGKAPAAATYQITGTHSQITIAASSYDTLESKKPLCESVTNSCQKVRDQVWPTFIREIAPTIKSAELAAESNMRTACISNISDCFQKACKDNIDPNDPDGSYDMCLSRPETVKSLCKVQIDPCISAEPLILDYVYARLAAMRVDACTTEVKQCLQSEDRCGEDYTQCVGLDTDTIVRMCPYDKLVGCQKVYKEKNIDIRGDDVYDELVTMVQGIMLGIDNNLLEFCQNAANEAMINVCGGTEDCNAITTDDHIGAGSLSYGICYYKISGDSAAIDYSQCRSSVDQIQDVELGRVNGSLTGELGPVVPFVSVIDGIMFWEQISVDNNGNITSPDEYFTNTDSSSMQPSTKDKIKSEISKLQTSINSTIQTIESDPTVQFCMTGRTVPGMKNAPVSATRVARFPQLTQQMRKTIATTALGVAKENYYKEYDISYEQQMQDYVTIAERQAEIKGENAKDARREAARISCVSLADMAALPMSPPPPSGWGTWFVAAVVVAAAVAVTVLTAGTGAPLATVVTAAATETSAAVLAPSAMFAAASTLTATGIGVVTAAGIGTASLIGGSIAAATANYSSGQNSATVARDLSGHHEMNQWNWKQVIDTTFEWETLKCHKCVKSTKCINQSYPWFGKPKCKQWAESTTECTDTQF